MPRQNICRGNRLELSNRPPAAAPRTFQQMPRGKPTKMDVEAAIVNRQEAIHAGTGGQRIAKRTRGPQLFSAAPGKRSCPDHDLPKIWSARSAAMGTRNFSPW